MKVEIIGTVISNEETPSFETVRIKLKPGKDIKPGTIITMKVTREEMTTLVARVRSGHENNPSKNVENVAVGDVMAITSPSLPEEYTPSIYRLIEADLIEEIFENELKIQSIRSPQSLPNSGSSVFMANSDEIRMALGIQENESEGLYLGETVGGLETKIILKREAIQRHFFIGGTTGSGKSYAMGVLAEELIKHNLPVVFIDTQDEYSSFVESHKGNVMIPGDNFTIRLSSCTESEFVSLLPSVMQKSDLQCNIASAIFRKLKLEKNRESFGTTEILELVKEFSIKLAANNDKDGRTADAVSDRLRMSFEMHKIFGNGLSKADWEKKVYPCASINCKHLLSRDLQFVATAVLRELQNLRLEGSIPPYVVVIDEAHLFVPQGESSPCKQIIREGVRIGRHHGICMVLMTQSPVDIDKSVIRQCNTRMVFALEPDQLEAIRGVKADATDEMLRALPKMPQGTCLLSGTYESLKHTIPVKIRKRYTENCEGGKTPDIFTEMKVKWNTLINRS